MATAVISCVPLSAVFALSGVPMRAVVLDFHASFASTQARAHFRFGLCNFFEFLSILFDRGQVIAHNVYGDGFVLENKQVKTAGETLFVSVAYFKSTLLMLVSAPPACCICV